MNNKGFTLIELIATIALLGVIAVISFVSINSIIVSSRDKECQTLVGNIKSATSEYVSDYRYDKSFTDLVSSYQIKITANTLIKEKYLKSELINPYTKETINPNNVEIQVKLNNDYTFKSATVSGISCNN